MTLKLWRLLKLCFLTFLERSALQLCFILKYLPGIKIPLTTLAWEALFQCMRIMKTQLLKHSCRRKLTQKYQLPAMKMLVTKNHQCRIKSKFNKVPDTFTEKFSFSLDHFEIQSQGIGWREMDPGLEHEGY